MRHTVAQIVSGGQTGVDRAALDVAIELGIPCGGWCPKGRRSEDGRIPDRYPLHATPSSDSWQRTAWNVRDSEGALVLTFGEPTGGAALTIRLAKNYPKPCVIVDLNEGTDTARVENWIQENEIGILNVTGTRASYGPDVYARAKDFLHGALGQFSLKAGP